MEEDARSIRSTGESRLIGISTRVEGARERRRKGKSGNGGNREEAESHARPLVVRMTGGARVGMKRESFLLFTRRADFLHRAVKKVLRAPDSHPTAIPRTGSSRNGRDYAKQRAISSVPEFPISLQTQPKLCTGAGDACRS